MLAAPIFSAATQSQTDRQSSNKMQLAHLLPEMSFECNTKTSSNTCRDCDDEYVVDEVGSIPLIVHPIDVQLLCSGCNLPVPDLSRQP